MNCQLRLFLLISFSFLLHFFGHADGSKDFYPKGVRGNRAFLLSRPPFHGEFSNFGRHFVYAKIGESIALASSAQNVGLGHMMLYSPSGKVYSSQGLTAGKIEGSGGISNREAELAGPRAGYNAMEQNVDEEGIWTVEFISPLGDNYRNADVLNVLADANWTQRDNENLIAAWDISVRNADNTDWIQGRVYAKVLNLHLYSGVIDDEMRAFYGVNYVLTKDGYLYRVDGNGSFGIRFTYFVNNAGLLNNLGEPLYKSSNAGFNVNLHDPNSNDLDDRYITHKMFYHLPADDLPKQSHTNLEKTWLKNEIEIAKVSNVRMSGSEGLNNYVNAKGVYISFETNYAGRYRVSIKSKNTEKGFIQRDMVVLAKEGDNTFHWDGRDGNGQLIPQGRYDVDVGVALIEGEVHFPYFDMEINPNGLKLERVNTDGTIAGAAIVYWDDSEVRPGIPHEQSNPLTNLQGISSYINGHRWGTYSRTSGNFNTGTGAFSFGNDIAMDTWSYTVQLEEALMQEVIVEVADLEVVSVQPNKQIIELNEEIVYRIVVKNNGPSEAKSSSFEYDMPLGFVISNVSKQGSCGNLSGITLNQNKVRTTLDLPVGCEMTLIVTAKSGLRVPDETYGFVDVEAGIVRPRGFTDPDATNPNIEINRPGSARDECIGNCNNIKTNNEVFLLEPENERGKLALLKTAKHIDANNSEFQELGEEVEYTFTIRNTGFVNVRDLIITDPLLTNTTINLPAELILKPNEEYTLVRKYTIKQEDLQRKFIQNSASVLGKNPRGFDVKDISGTSFTNDEPTTIDVNQKPYVALKKTVINKGTGENNQFTIGDRILYEFEVKHEGDIAVSELQLVDEKIRNQPINLGGKLDNANAKYQFEYTINESDVLRGFVENSATLFTKDVKTNKTISDISGITFYDDKPTLTSIAKAHRAINDHFDIYQNNQVVLDVLANDEHGSSTIETVGIKIVSQPSKGRIRIENNKIVYTPNNPFEFGEDEFTYHVLDKSRLYSNTAKVTILIQKTQPIAVDDEFVVGYNSAIRISPAENDYVEHNRIDKGSIRIISYPHNGLIKSEGNGIFTFVPERTFSGYDEFQYVIADESGNWSEPATVRIEAKGFFIPNVITPNGDGLNDTFEIIGIYAFDQIELQIFDRFGKSIYHSSNYKNDWEVDSSIPEGTYYYRFSAQKNGEKATVKKGSFLILRTKL